jgi:SAM-dependent methyltransferase
LARQNALLLKQPKGRALDLACGNGRNSIYLARLGFDVDSFDISNFVIDWLKGEVDRLQLPVKPKCVNLETCEFSKETYQVIINFNYLERRVFPRLVDALAPGGLLLFETMTHAQDGVFKDKFSPEHSLQEAELKHSFPALETIFYREGLVGPKGRERTVESLVARKS